MIKRYPQGDMDSHSFGRNLFRAIIIDHGIELESHGFISFSLTDDVNICSLCLNLQTLIARDGGLRSHLWALASGYPYDVTKH